MITPDGLILPDFLVGGAARSGTTWLRHVLAAHPDIHMAEPWPPEPQFFYHDDRYSKGIEAYSREWFDGVDTNLVIGEKSTAYLESADAADRIRHHLPDVKMIFLLRDPVDRAFNNYLWTRHNGLESKSFSEALESEIEREAELPESLRFVRPFSYYQRGLYADFLKVYFERFDRERILCLRFDDISERPGDLCARVHAFLGVAERPGDGEAMGVVNRARGEEVEVLSDSDRKKLVDAYAEPNERLAAMLGPEFGW